MTEPVTEQLLDPDFLGLLVCPKTKKPLKQIGNKLVCEEAGYAYPIENGIPVLLVERAEPWPAKETE
jgi:hypothetical protein